MREQARLHVRLAADAASVPAVRRFVVDGLTAWGEADLVEAAELVASELSSNAALHAAAAFMHVTLERGVRSAGVRVAVEDDGPVPPDAVRLRVLLDPDDVHDPVEPVGVPRTDGVPSTLPPGWALVRLVGCPVELSIQQDNHLDELVRELQLLSLDEGNDDSGALAEEIRGLLVSPTHARLTGRRAAERARAEGRGTVDIEMAMPREFGQLVSRLHEAVARADVLCEDGRLLTLASPPELRALRAWMTHEVLGQTTDGATPVPWSAWPRTSTHQEGSSVGSQPG